MSSPPTEIPDQFEKLSVVELIRLLPSTKEEKYDERYHSLTEHQKKELKHKRETFIRESFRCVLDALWLRHQNDMRKALSGKVFAPGSTLCPPQEPSKEDFVAAVLSRAYQAFLARTICKEYVNFPGYIWTVVFRAALDERKHLKGRFDDEGEKGAGGESHAQPELENHDTIGDAMGPQKPILVPLPEGMPEPQAKQLDPTNKLDVRRILYEYVRESQENRESAYAVVRKRIEEWTWEELATVLGVGAMSARRFVEKDEEALRPRLSLLLDTSN